MVTGNPLLIYEDGIRSGKLGHSPNAREATGEEDVLAGGQPSKIKG